METSLKILIKKIKELHARFKRWKPLHLCWWFEKHNLPIPPYLIGGGSSLEQTRFKWSYDNGTSSTNPNVRNKIADVNAFPGEWPSNQDCRVHLRIQVAETGGKGVDFTPALYVNTVNDPSTAYHVDGSNSMAELIDDRPGLLADLTRITSSVLGYDYSWVDGYYVDDSSVLPTVTLGGQCIEFQFCLNILTEGTHSFGDTYYFFLKDVNDGALDVYTNVPTIVTCETGFQAIKWFSSDTQTISFNTAWEIREWKYLTKNTSWLIKSKNDIITSWAVGLEIKTLSESFEWKISTSNKTTVLWTIGDFYFLTQDTKWAIYNSSKFTTSALIKTYLSKELEWSIPRALFDVEVEDVATNTNYYYGTGLAAYEIYIDTLIPNTLFQWRVRLTDDGSGNPGAWTYWETFTTEILHAVLGWKIANKQTSNTSWGVCGKMNKNVSWEIKKLIDVPINLTTSSIESTTARFNWTM